MRSASSIPSRVTFGTGLVSHAFGHSNVMRLPLRAANTDVEADDPWPGFEGRLVDVVDYATQVFPGRFRVGDDVAPGLAKLRDEPVLVEKTVRDLVALARLSNALRLGQGRLRCSVVDWLQLRGVDASGESKTTRRSTMARRRRTFHDGIRQRVFDLHTKPTNACAPDRCARIYFDLADDRCTVILGYIGRHP